jgi:hypothetical protein
LRTLLPKIHINGNTVRTIIFRPEELGCLALPHIYTEQGISKLYLFLGHLRLQDKTGKLIEIDISYIQLFTGWTTFFFNESNSQFQNWIDSGWLTSIWEFSNHSHLTYLMPQYWTPKPSHERDKALMEFFMDQRLHHSTLDSINLCRVYLQVITIADISSADGTYIIPEVKLGKNPIGRKSNLDWPKQGQPSSADWINWRSNLFLLEHNGKLIQPLGE